MKQRIFRAILAGTLISLAASLVLIVAVLHGYLKTRTTEELAQTTAYVAHGVQNEGITYLSDGIPKKNRITWVDATGQVIFDNWQDEAEMENHADREEIHEAMQLGSGEAIRYSNTLSEQAIYYAVRLEDGSVVRLAVIHDTVWALVLRALKPMLLVMALALSLTLWLAGRLSRQLVEPINQIDLAAPDAEQTYEELAPLISRIRSQNRQIGHHVELLRQRQQEFDAITEHMSEGLLVLDREGRVLSCNSAALGLLGLEDGTMAEGKSVLALNREAGVRHCVEEVRAGRRCEELLERDESCCRMFANPVKQEGSLSGAVLIMVDVTEKERREALRREFTANVSHELKTPLTSILGTAEILKSGLVKPEDTAHFAGNIHKEAQRLIGLVNDIIKISRLDEGGPSSEWEDVDLKEAAVNVMDQLAQAADQKGVTMTLEGSCGRVRGVYQIVEEILYNLCDNAIAYNRPGGTVSISLSSTKEGQQVQVRDTGIGIPREMQDRVFERFYRVDKSHSGNGTGLGLSIVKHGAAYLGAWVTLESEQDRGSTFTLVFPDRNV